jgi:hypothetical protein
VALGKYHGPFGKRFLREQDGLQAGEPAADHHEVGGHTANLEEPDVFNDAVDTFPASVARGSWHARDPRSRSASTTGTT